MGDEITIKSDPASAATTPALESQTNSDSKRYSIGICALGLGVSFFLPWATIFGALISGFDLQKDGGGKLSLWLIPLLSAISVITILSKRSVSIVGPLTGMTPYLAAIYWYVKLGNDLFRVMTYGAYISLLCGACLIALSRKWR